jgi:predicted cupin superfamily sugar epimerase
MNAQILIKELGLEPLPDEGGFYRETWRSPQRLKPGSGKSAGTAIYYLLTEDSFSHLHRLPTDEVYHFYLGDPVRLLQLFPDGTGVATTLGSDILNGQVVQCIVPADTWQGSRLVPGGSFALLGTTMAPGFDFSDYEPGDREKLIADYEAFADLISQLTA